MVHSAMLDNSSSGKWNLCNSPIDYIHGFVKHYLAGEDELYIITDVEDD